VTSEAGEADALAGDDQQRDQLVEEAEAGVVLAGELRAALAEALAGVLQQQPVDRRAARSRG
jgi:actin-related protein